MRTAKALAYTPRVLVSTVLTMMVGAVLPALAAWVLFVGGLLTGALLLGGFRRADSGADPVPGAPAHRRGAGRAGTDDDAALPGRARAARGGAIGPGPAGRRSPRQE